MGAFLKINTSSSPISLIQANSSTSNTDYQYSVNQILTTFAANSLSTYVGTVSVNPGSTSGLTSIGTFTDTFPSYAQGTHGNTVNGTTITTVTYTFYQNLGTATETLVRPIEYSAGTKEQVDTSLNGDLITVALANMVSQGVGSYYVSASAPTGGTWVSQGSFTDKTSTSTTGSTYNLWRKTAPTSSPGVTTRPIKINSGTPISLKEMADADIQSLTTRLQNQIVSTGIGKYAVQSTAPTPGTWVAVGTMNNTVDTITQVAYTIYYAGTRTAYYTGNTVSSTTSTSSTTYLWIRTA